MDKKKIFSILAIFTIVFSSVFFGFRKYEEYVAKQEAKQAEQKQVKLVNETKKVADTIIENKENNYQLLEAYDHTDLTLDGLPTPEEVENALNNINQVRDQIVGTMKIDSIGLDIPLLVGSSYENLLYGACTFENNDLNNLRTGKGNMVLASHNTPTYGLLFSRVPELTVGKDIRVKNFENKEFNYKVLKKYTVDKGKGAEVTEETGKDLLTLVTCEDWRGTNNRVIVVAERV